MRRVYVLLLVTLLYAGVYAQTPTEIIGGLFSSVGSTEGLALSLAMAVIVGAVAYIGLGRIWDRGSAKLVAAAMALATFLFTFTPGSRVGIPTVSLPRFFATLPVIRSYPIIVDIILPIAALFSVVGLIIYYGKGEGKGMRNMALAAGVALMIIGGLLASLGIVGTGGAMVIIGFIIFGLAVVYYFGGDIISGGRPDYARSGRGGARRPGLLNRASDFVFRRQRLWILVVDATSLSDADRRRVAEDPARHGGLWQGLPVVDNAQVRVTPLRGVRQALQGRRIWNFRTDSSGYATRRWPFVGEGELSVQVQAPNFDNFTGVYKNLLTETPRPQVVVPLKKTGAAVAAAGTAMQRLEHELQLMYGATHNLGVNIHLGRIIVPPPHTDATLDDLDEMALDLQDATQTVHNNAAAGFNDDCKNDLDSVWANFHNFIQHVCFPGGPLGPGAPPLPGYPPGGRPPEIDALHNLGTSVTPVNFQALTQNTVAGGEPELNLLVQNIHDANQTFAQAVQILLDVWRSPAAAIADMMPLIQALINIMTS